MHSKSVYSMAEVTRENQETIPLLLPKKAARVPGVQFFFTTRRGGVSQGSYASLNLGQHVGDNPLAVSSNRARVAAALAVEGASAVCYVNQVHGTTTVEAAFWPMAPPDADALVTRQTGLVLAILTADCAPVLFADVDARVVGAAHAGWRGSVSGVLESCLDAMIRLGANQKRIHALIGPCIQQPSYQVDRDFKKALLTDSHNKIAFEARKIFSEQKKVATLLLDLPGYVRGRLEFYGLLRERIYDVSTCTYQKESDFFSHRRATQRGCSPCGRQIGGVFLL